MGTPEPRAEGTVSRIGRAAEARGLGVAVWAGRGDHERGLSLLALVLAAVFFIVLFLPWVGNHGEFNESGWIAARDPGLVSLAVVLVETLRLGRAWVSSGSALLAFCLIGAAGVLGVESLATLRWSGYLPAGFRAFQYGAWLGLVVAILLIAVAALKLAGLWRSAS